MNPVRAAELSRCAAICAAFPGPENYEIRVKAIICGWTVARAMEEVATKKEVKWRD